MQRSTLFCAPLIAICLAAVGAAADSESRDIATLEPDYMPLVPVVMDDVNRPSTTQAAASDVHYVTESPATASRAYYMAESPARVTTAYYLTESPAASAPVLPASASRAVYVTPSPVVTSGCGCSPSVVTASTYYQPAGMASGSLPTVMSSAPAIVTPGTPCNPPAAVCCPSPYTTGVPVVAYRPVAAVAPLPPRHRFGRGMIGQPVVYVSGQPIRNALRWFFP
jgi:hypothetical protein